MKKVKIELTWDEMDSLNQLIANILVPGLYGRTLEAKMLVTELILLEIRFRKKLIFHKPGKFKISLPIPEACALAIASVKCRELVPYETFVGNVLTRVCNIIDQTLK